MIRVLLIFFVLFNAGIAFADENAEVTIAEMTLGSEEAEVHIVEYASYTCPHCATFHTEIYPRLKKDYIETGKVRFTYREIYFDKYGFYDSALCRSRKILWLNRSYI